MINTMKRVREFHRAFKVVIHEKINLFDTNLNDLRIRLLAEELDELSVALAARDGIEVLDALLDLQYVLDGAFLSLGFAQYKDEGFLEVHRSNMSKLDDNGKPIVREDGKIMKGQDFFEPDLWSIING